uniref:T6PP_N domain-containing protein n=1 Tax=Steinernema glaseri TaxID=37863 RepID=A0A1I7ZXX3_9BILA
MGLEGGGVEAPVSGDHESVEEFKAMLYEMQKVRRKIVLYLLGHEVPPTDSIPILEASLARLRDKNTSSDLQRTMWTACNEPFVVNVKDEICGLEKDLAYLRAFDGHLVNGITINESIKAIELMNDLAYLRAFDGHLVNGITINESIKSIELMNLLRSFHPTSEEAFDKEFDECKGFMKKFIESSGGNPDLKPIFVTDWDGTMKDYCSQYATNLQPIYSAVSLARFAGAFTRLAAVLTAGPLRGPGILDLTALPINGPLVFSGSWGREWWLDGKRVVHNDGISEEGFDALERMNDQMRALLDEHPDFGQFALVGSGVQRKVDRLTLGVQTVCAHVNPDISKAYMEAIRERMHRVDPNKKVLHFDASTELEVEVVVRSEGGLWNKANGVARIVEAAGLSLEPPRSVLICGDTSSDLPMVRQAVASNAENSMALFVGRSETLKQSVRDLVGDDSRCCFVSCPDVVHAAMTSLCNSL